MTILLCSLSAVIGAALGYHMARPRKVRPRKVHLSFHIGLADKPEPSEFSTFWSGPSLVQPPLAADLNSEVSQ